jgi:Flp pilus assembly pilin Flp
MTRAGAQTRVVSAGEEGATAVEYALLLVLVAAVIVATVAALGLLLPGGFEQVSGGIP